MSESPEHILTVRPCDRNIEPFLLRWAKPQIQSLRPTVQRGHGSSPVRAATTAIGTSKHTIAQVHLLLKPCATSWKHDSAFSGSMNIAEHPNYVTRFSYGCSLTRLIPNAMFTGQGRLPFCFWPGQSSTSYVCHDRSSYHVSSTIHSRGSGRPRTPYSGSRQTMQVMLARRLSRSGQATNVHVWILVDHHLRTDPIHQAISVRLLRNEANRLNNRPAITKGFRCGHDQCDAAANVSPAVSRDAVPQRDTFDEFACYANQEHTRLFAHVGPKGSQRSERFEVASSRIET